MLHGYCRLDYPRAKKNCFSTAAEVGLVGATPQRGGGLDALWRHVRLLKKKIMDLIGLIINKIRALYLYIYIQVGGLEHECYFSIYWEYHHPNLPD
jgi:hypothetical protein